MSPETHGLTWSELDRLADYTADALDPAETAQVAHLVRTNPRWSAAHRDLREAETAVRFDLAAAAAVSTPMPADVAAQLDAALGRLNPAGATVISLDAARSKRRRTIMAGIAAAAATVVAVFGGLALNGQQPSSGTNAAVAPAEGQGARDAPGAAPEVPAPSAVLGQDQAMPGGPRMLASGTDYRLDTLRLLAAQSPPPGSSGGVKASETPLFAAEAAPSALTRLTTPDGLADCLRAVTGRYPGSAVVLDYARFEGQPALMIVVRLGTTSTIIAVGPQCGVSGTDEKASASVS